MNFSTQRTTDLYFESHVTIDPVLGDVERRVLEIVAEEYGFRVAKLFMLKGGENQRDAFMTARSKDFEDISERTLAVVEALEHYGFEVRRYKIENTLVDVRPKKGA